MEESGFDQMRVPYRHRPDDTKENHEEAPHHKRFPGPCLNQRTAENKVVAPRAGLCCSFVQSYIKFHFTEYAAVLPFPYAQISAQHAFTHLQ